MPFEIRYWIPETKSTSSISPSAHQPALFFIQDGISCEVPWPDWVGGIRIISSIIKYSIPETKSESWICPVAHQPALFLTQLGISIGAELYQLFQK